jgi:membrane associated rhomboid family serine protease
MSEPGTESVGDQPVGQIPHCYRHPNREALVRCTRCDRPICPECMRPASVGFHCPEDVALARKTMRPQRTTVGARLRNSPPYVTGALIAANVVVYVITGAQAHNYGDPSSRTTTSGLFYKWQLWPIYTKDHHAYYQLLTSAFVHVNLLHIASNMIALAVVGPHLERLLGPGRYTALYFVAALGGGAAEYIFGSALVPVVGASGAIFGLFAACLVMVRQLGLDRQWLIGIIVLNFVFTFSVQGISKLGHVGGFVVGGLAGIAIAGLPLRGRSPRRMSLQQQAAGLAVLTVAIVVAVAVRTSAVGF